MKRRSRKEFSFKCRKDQCDLCCAQMGNLESSLHEEHFRRKTEARNKQVRDKEAVLARNGKVITLSLQTVLLAPNLKASAMYYKSKLACHNYTIFDLAT